MNLYVMDQTPRRMNSIVNQEELAGFQTLSVTACESHGRDVFSFNRTSAFFKKHRFKLISKNRGYDNA